MTMTKTFFMPRLWQGEDLPCGIHDARAALTSSECGACTDIGPDKRGKTGNCLILSRLR